mgnify:CR=1 FL=1
MSTLTIIVPVYNEGRKLAGNLGRIMEVVSGVQEVQFEYIVVNDGSTDDTVEQVQSMSHNHPEIGIISLTRNFGKEAAILAGLRHAQGEAAIVMDSDLQHPPELIPQMIRLWQEGMQVVEACKSYRGRESWNKKLSAGGFYWIFDLLVSRDLKNHSDFKLLDRKVIDAYLALPERRRFFRGLISWLGFPSAQIFFEVPDREHGHSGWSSLNLLRLSVDALTGFTSAPLYLINILGGLCLLLGAVVGGIALYDKVTGQAVSGFTTVILLILIIGGCIMIGLGLIGIYIGQIFKEVKHRPVYVVDEEKSTFTADRGPQTEDRGLRTED